MLARLHEDPRRDLVAGEVVEDVVDAVGGTTDDDVVDAVDRLDDRDRIDHPGGLSSTVSLTPDGLRRYEELSGETVVGGDAERKLLRTLSEREREGPGSPAVDRGHLVDELDLWEAEVDTLVWYLDDAGLVETAGGIDQEFLTVAITERGRERLE